jgi:hypothetical protein
MMQEMAVNIAAAAFAQGKDLGAFIHSMDEPDLRREGAVIGKIETKALKLAFAKKGLAFTNFEYLQLVQNVNVDKDGNVCLSALVNCVKSHMCSELTRGRSMCKQAVRRLVDASSRAEPDLRGRVRPCFECRDDPGGDDGDGNGEGGGSQALIPAGSGDSDRARGAAKCWTPPVCTGYGRGRNSRVPASVMGALFAVLEENDWYLLDWYRTVDRKREGVIR